MTEPKPEDELAAEEFSYAQAGMQAPSEDSRYLYERAVKEGFLAGCSFKDKQFEERINAAAACIERKDRELSSYHQKLLNSEEKIQRLEKLLDCAEEALEFLAPFHKGAFSGQGSMIRQARKKIREERGIIERK